MRALILIGALALGACSTTQTVPVSVNLPKPTLPQECKTGSGAWQDLPDAAVSKSELGRLWVANRRAYRGLRHRHAICRKFAQQQSQKKPGARPGG